MNQPATTETTDIDLGGGKPWFYRGLRAVVMVWFKLWFRLDITGQENIPTRGGFILAPGGHRSILDTPLAAATTPRILRFMGAEKYFATPGLGPLLLALGGFPVERSTTDREALRLAEMLLRSGDPLVIFPESTRFSGPVVEPIKEGAAFMACRTGVPIIPVGIGGAERAMSIGARFIRPSKCSLVIGEPIVPPERVDGARVKRSTVQAVSADLQTTLQRLFDQAQISAGA